MEGAAGLPGAVAKPEWYQGCLSWFALEQCVLWRADETELVTALPIKTGGILGTDPGLADAWWATLSQERVTATIERVFPGGVETTVTEWAVAHADLAWANLTGPECWLLDWEFVSGARVVLCGQQGRNTVSQQFQRPLFGVQQATA